MVCRNLFSSRGLIPLALLLLGTAPLHATLYAVDSQTDQVYRIDPQTAAATLIGPAGQQLESAGLAYDPITGRVFVSNVLAPGAIDGGGLGTLDLRTGAVQPVPGGTDYVNSLSVPGIVFLRGLLIGASTNLPGRVVLDQHTSATFSPVPWSFSQSVYSLAPRSGAYMAIDPEYFYLSEPNNDLNLIPIVQHGIWPPGTLGAVGGLAYEPGLDAYFASNAVNGQLYRIDLGPQSGATVTLIGNTGIHPSGLVGVPSLVEIPTLDARGVFLLAALLSGLALLALRRGRPQFAPRRGR